MKYLIRMKWVEVMEDEDNSRGVNKSEKVENSTVALFIVGCFQQTQVWGSVTDVEFFSIAK